MEKVKTDILILRCSDVIERFRSDFDPQKIGSFIEKFPKEIADPFILSSLVLFIDNDGKTTILKNRYGNNQIIKK